MNTYWMASAVAFGLLTTCAFAQTAAPEPNRSTNGPAGTVETAHTGIAVDPSGAATGTSDTFKKTQSYTSGDGQLSAKTNIHPTGPATPIEK
jgi:hypothetical protein